MPLPRLVKKSGEAGPREVCPAENLRAIVTGIYFVGTQVNKFQPDQRPALKIVMRFEVDSQKTDGSNHLLSSVFTYSLHERSALSKQFGPIMGNAWPQKDGDPFDLTILLGLPCMVDIKHNVKPDGTVSAKIDKISKMPRGFSPFETDSNQVVWCFDDPGAMAAEGVPDWIKKMAEESVELAGSNLSSVPASTPGAVPARGHVVDPDGADAPF